MALVTNQENPEQPQQQPQEPEKPEIPGFSIISRYPNCSAKIERNLAEQSNSKVLHDFQKNPALNREPQISRLSNSARIYNKHGSDKAENQAENDSDTESVAQLFRYNVMMLVVQMLRKIWKMMKMQILHQN